MKHFLIRYRFEDGSREDWHQEIARFIAALDADPELAGKISYRAMKLRDDDTSYLHLAAAADDDAVKALGQRTFFKHYTEQTELVSRGSVEVLPLEIIAETKAFAGT
jgi:quinol monooxygenase YgiN